jgi:hypothetical protein
MLAEKRVERSQILIKTRSCRPLLVNLSLIKLLKIRSALLDVLHADTLVDRRDEDKCGCECAKNSNAVRSLLFPLTCY